MKCILYFVRWPVSHATNKNNKTNIKRLKGFEMFKEYFFMITEILLYNLLFPSMIFLCLASYGYCHPCYFLKTFMVSV